MRPEWLKAPNVVDVCSVSGCVNDNLVDIESVWEHNAFGVANDPETLWRIASASHIDTSNAQLFFYEAYEQEIESENWLKKPSVWRPFTPVSSGKIEERLVVAPENKRLLGYDVVTCEDYLEHSPLSCNSVAASLSVNEHCLFDSLEQAKEAIEAGHFTNCEPGVYKIYSVYLVTLA